MENKNQTQTPSTELSQFDSQSTETIKQEMKTLIFKELEALKEDEDFDEADKIELVFDEICPVGYKDAELKSRLGMDSDEILDFIMEVLK